MITYRAPTSRNIKGAISPVCAPSSFWVAQSWPATRIFEPSRRSATVLIAVKTGAITTSQWFALATKGLSDSAVSTASPSVLYIFQFPAITGLRIVDLDFDLRSLILVSFKPHSRLRRRATLRPREIREWHRRQLKYE